MSADSRAGTATFDVIVVGAGFAGVCAAIKLSQQGTDNFLVFEKAAGIGGTWWYNTYPGAACDIASHLYCYSFEPNPDWSRKYSPQPEIQAYIEHCARKYGVLDRIRLNAPVEHCEFDQDRELWLVTTPAGISAARHVIFAGGGLHRPVYPDIPGRDSFNGPAMHSAEWDHSVDFSNRRVAVIGSAASAIQLVPELAKVAASVDVYQRTPNYIAPRGDREFSALERRRFARWPWLNRLYRRYLFLRGEWLLYPIVRSKKRSRWRSRVERMLRSHMRTVLIDSATREAMIPAYPLGCKRILSADNFLPALNLSHVKLRTSPIDRIDTGGLHTADGRYLPADILVFATGFDLEEHMRRTPVTGVGGLALCDAWADLPAAYKGGFVPGFPNFYFTTGPNTGVGTTSIVLMIEAQMELILQAIAAAGRSRLIEVKQHALQRYNEDIQRALQGTVWAGSCSSWYKREDGRISSLYPYDARTYIADHRRLVMADFQLSDRH